MKVLRCFVGLAFLVSGLALTLGLTAKGASPVPAGIIGGVVSWAGLFVAVEL